MLLSLSPRFPRFLVGSFLKHVLNAGSCVCCSCSSPLGSYSLCLMGSSLSAPSYPDSSQLLEWVIFKNVNVMSFPGLKYFNGIYLLVCLLKQGLMWPRLASHWLCSQRWPWTYDPLPFSCQLLRLYTKSTMLRVLILVDSTRRTQKVLCRECSLVVG